MISWIIWLPISSVERFLLSSPIKSAVLNPSDNTLFTELLIKSDVGVEASSDIRKIISEKKINPNLNSIDEVNKILTDYIISIMKPLEKNDFFNNQNKLNIILISGVNGVGKTTTIGKIGKILKDNGNKVVFSASDTFREWFLDARGFKNLDKGLIKVGFNKEEVNDILGNNWFNFYKGIN